MALTDKPLPVRAGIGPLRFAATHFLVHLIVIKLTNDQQQCSNAAERLRMKAVAGLLAVFSLGGLPAVGVDARTITPMQANAWEIGPIIKHRNYSIGLFRPSQYRRGWGFTISPRAEPHYVTFRHGSLRGKTQIRMRFRIEGSEGAIIYGAKCPTGFPSAVLLYFHRKGDNWRTDRARWWASFAKVTLRGPMPETEIVAPLNARWTSVFKMTAKDHPNEFAAAKANADRVGFTFANCSGYGQGARATVPVKFVVTSFEVL